MSIISLLKKKELGSPILRGKKYIDYKDIRLLLYFTDRFGRIKPRKYTGATIAQQKILSRAIKNSRIMGLLAFVKYGE